MFFFLENTSCKARLRRPFFSMKSNARRGAPEWCSFYVSRKILALLKRRESWSSERVEGVGVCEPEFWRFEDCKCSKRCRQGGSFQFLEVIGTNVLANEVVRHVSNLTAKECLESAKRVLRAKHALARIIDFNSSEHLPW